MSKASDKEAKSIYQSFREELNLSRDKASELLESISPERIERIENGKFPAHPDEVVIMAEKYKAPELCKRDRKRIKITIQKERHHGKCIRIF